MFAKQNRKYQGYYVIRDSVHRRTLYRRKAPGLRWSPPHLEHTERNTHSQGHTSGSNTINKGPTLGHPTGSMALDGHTMPGTHHRGHLSHYCIPSILVSCMTGTMPGTTTWVSATGHTHRSNMQLSHCNAATPTRGHTTWLLAHLSVAPALARPTSTTKVTSPEAGAEYFQEPSLEPLKNPLWSPH